MGGRKALLLYLMFAASFLVEVRLPWIAISAANLAVPACAAALLWSARSSAATAVRRHRRLLLALGAFYLWTAIAAATSEFPTMSTWYVLKYSTHVFVFFALLITVQRPGAVWPALTAAYVSLILLAALGLLEYLWPRAEVLAIFRKQSLVYPRISSLFIWPNQFAVLMAAALGLGASLRRAGRISATLSYAAAAILLLVLAISGSRNGWLLLCLLLVLLPVCRLATWRQSGALAAAFALMLVYFPVSTAQLGLQGVRGLPLMQHLTEVRDWDVPGTSSPRETIAPRFALWSAALAEIGRHPIRGIGPEVFSITIGPKIVNQSSINAHNLFLNIGAETGLVGLGLFLLYLALLLRAGDMTCWPTSIPLLVVIAGQLFDCFIYDHAFMTFSVVFAACHANSRRSM